MVYSFLRVFAAKILKRQVAVMQIAYSLDISYIYTYLFSVIGILYMEVTYSETGAGS